VTKKGHQEFRVLKIEEVFAPKGSISEKVECMAKKGCQKCFGDKLKFFLEKVIRKFGPRIFFVSAKSLPWPYNTY